MKPLDEKQSKFKKTVVCKPYEYGALKGLILSNFFVNIKITWRRRMDEVKSVMKHFVLHVYPDFVNLRKLGGGGGAGFIWPTTIRLFVRNVTDTSLCTFCGQKYNTSYLFLQCQISYNFGVN